MTAAQAAVDAILARTGGEVRLALPLGLGKPVTLVNALVERACDDPSVSLSIFTALTLERPAPSSDIERRFLEPAMDRLFGDYPELLYAKLLREDRLPDNIEVSEFFLLAGRWLGVAPMQQRYISANYTHALHVLLDQKPNVLAQLVAAHEDHISLSSNTDISADLFALRAAGEIDFIAAGEVHPDLPFMNGPQAIWPRDVFEVMLGAPAPYELFSAVRRPVDPAAHAIGLHASRLIVDGGTLQIGIGSIGDAVAHALLLRHRGETKKIQASCPFPISADRGGRFDEGLYAVTEMLVGGLLELFESDVIKREVEGHAIDAGFFVETRDFYRKLRELPKQKHAKIAMRPVSFTNQLYGDEEAKRAARVDARFVNGAMQVSCLGEVMSDARADGQVVSGVGGQFNFIEQAFALEGARAIITLPATRTTGGKVVSNIRWQVAAVTVPRHMRDIVVTEYGVADLRGQPDAEVIARLIAIADARFQDGLIAEAKAAGKLPEDFALPDAARRNTPEVLRNWLAPHADLLPRLPFGTDFDETERMLLPVLERLGNEAATWQGKARLLWSALALPAAPREAEALARMGYDGSDMRSLQALALRGALRRDAKAT